MLESNVNLPECYSFVEKGQISGNEVLALRDASDWGTVRDVQKWQRALDTSLAVAGVRSESKELVGVGFLAGNARQAILCDLVVHPEHRGKNIGKAILSQRLKQADEIGVDYIYTELSETNNLSSFYLAVGFRAVNNALVRSSH